MDESERFARWLAVAPVGAEVHGVILRRAGSALFPGRKLRVTTLLDVAAVRVAGVGETHWYQLGDGSWECVNSVGPDKVQTPREGE